MEIEITHTQSGCVVTSNYLKEKEYSRVYNYIKGILSGATSNKYVEIPSKGGGFTMIPAQVLRESFIAFND